MFRNSILDAICIIHQDTSYYRGRTAMDMMVADYSLFVYFFWFCEEIEKCFF